MPRIHIPTPALVPITTDSTTCPFTYPQSARSIRWVSGRPPRGGKRRSITASSRGMSSSM